MSRRGSSERGRQHPQRFAPTSEKALPSASHLERSASARSSEASLHEGKPTDRLSGENEVEEQFQEKRETHNTCHEDKFAPATSCPESCPFAAELEHKFCHFMCVHEKECGLNGTKLEATIPDKEAHDCRHCNVAGCATCVAGKPGEDIERCEKCMPGYFLRSEGTCGSFGDYVIGVILAISFVAALIGAIWHINLVMRPIVNEQGWAHGLRCRERARVLQRNGEEYPLTTNLTTTNVAGPGAMALFRFEAAVMVWATMLLLTWVALALAVSTDLFIIGIRKASTPQEFCAVIRWGRHRQMQLVWVKCVWLGIMYLGTFIGTMVFGYQIERLYHVLNEDVTMADFAATCSGIPALKGDERVEDQIKQALEQQTGERVVGVSCAWNYHHHAGEVKTALEVDLGSLELSSAAAHRRSTARGSVAMGVLTGDMAPAQEEQAGPITRACNMVSQGTLLAWGVSLETGKEHEHEIGETLREMTTTDTAFVVFETEGGRERAVKAAKGTQLTLGEARLSLQAASHEPEAVLWEEFAVGQTEHILKVAKAYVYTLSSSILWTVILYLPYAHYMASFSYANGDKPGEFSEGLFTGLVCAGNLFICVVASIFIKGAGFRFVDDEERSYAGLYTFALLLNLFLDMCLTAFLSYRQMVGVGVHTADGRLLKDLTSYQQIFESYPMQKSLGKLLFAYCWPATFFLPFVGEALVISALPVHIGSLFVRSDTRLRGKLAEQALALSVFEQTRYGDLMFNIIVACLIPYIAPAYILFTFSVLLFSHAFIYLYDQWKVLRGVVRFWYSGISVCQYGQKLFAIPTGMLLSALVFKLNQWSGKVEDLGSGRLQGFGLVGTMAAVFVVHVALHILLLEYVIPRLAAKPGDLSESEARYEDCAHRTPCSWFSSNPVHCLRSKYIFQDKPPQRFYVVGKEHLLEVNPAIGAHYDPAARERERLAQAEQEARAEEQEAESKEQSEQKGDGQ